MTGDLKKFSSKHPVSLLNFLLEIQEIMEIIFVDIVQIYLISRMNNEIFVIHLIHLSSGLKLPCPQNNFGWWIGLQVILSTANIM